MSGDKQEAGALALPERCGVSAAQEIAEAGRGLEPGGRLDIDAGQVSRMSCATAVALVSAARSATASGGALVIRAPTAAFTDAFADLGLFEALMNMEFAE